MRDVVHTHHHVVGGDVPQQVAQQVAVNSVPSAPPTVAVRTRVYTPPPAGPSFSISKRHVVTTTKKVPRDRTVFRHAAQKAAIRQAAAPKTPQWTVKGPGYHFPLVDRRRKRTRYTVVAETDGSDSVSRDPSNPNWKPHTSAELEAEAKKMLKRAKELQKKKLDRKLAKKKKLKEKQSMGIFDAADVNYEDEITRLARVSARMNRLLEQIQQPRLTDSFEQSIARKRYFLKLYKELKKEASDIMESYALRTGNSIFSLFGDEPMDPNIAAFLPPNSLAAILNQYANPTRPRAFASKHDVISGKEAKRIKYRIDLYNARKNGTALPPKPVFYKPPPPKPFSQDPRVNLVLGTQQGAFGSGRPAVTFGDKIGRGGVHISVVNPTKTQSDRGLPFRTRFNKKQRKSKKSGKKY